MSEPIEIDWSTRDTAEGLNAICSHYYPWSQQLAEIAISRMPVQCDHNHLRSSAGLALLEAVRRFDPSKGIKFRSFATLRIRGAIIDAMRESDHLSRLSRSWIKQRKAAEAELLAKLFRAPSPEEVCERLDWSLDQYWMSLERVLGSIEYTAHEGDRKDSTVADDLADERQPFSLERQANFTEIMRDFSIEERTIVYLYYYRHASMKIIGQAMGFSESRVSQLHKQIIDRLKQLPERFQKGA